MNTQNPLRKFCQCLAGQTLRCGNGIVGRPYRRKSHVGLPRREYGRATLPGVWLCAVEENGWEA